MRTAQTLILTAILLLLPIVTVQAKPSSKLPPHSKAGPPFSLKQQNDRWWLVSPQGKPFFSLGVCCVTPGESWLDYNPKNPGYAAWQHYPDATSWADATLTRLKSWGFTTIGGWSDYPTLKRSSQMDMPYTLVLHLGATSGAPWWDMWDPKVIATMEETAQKQILPVRDDTRLLGYYTDNEMGWWNAALFKMTLQQSPRSGQRKRLIRMLRDHYHDVWSRLLADFVPEGTDSFATLDRKGLLYLRPGSNGMRQIKQFVSMMADRYYALMRQVVRKYDPRGLLLGDRYQSFFYPEVARACRPYVDAVSSNVNPNWTDGTLVRFYLDTLHALADRPIMVGEFYMTATENRSGNKNDSSGFPVVPTQQERAAGFRTTLDAFARTPYIAGADWFQYSDEPEFGRGDGENYDMGLVDIHDQPYEELTAAASAFAPDRVHALPSAVRPNACAGIPPAPPDPPAHSKPMEALSKWDRERGFVPPHSPYPVADLYLCWDQDAVYAGLYAMDPVETGYYKSGHVPEVDRMEWSLQPGDSKQPIRIRLGAGRNPAVHAPGVTVTDLSGRDRDVRQIAVARLPAALFGRQKLRAGDTIRLSSTLNTLARAYRVEWSGEFKLAE